MTIVRHAAVLLAFAAFTLSPRTVVAQDGTRQVIGNSTATLSPAIRWGDFLFVSGQLGVSRAAPDSTAAGQTKLALDNLKSVLESAGTGMSNVVKCTVYLVDVKDFGGMNSSYAAAFGKEPPARTTVVVAALVSAAARVEIECMAGIPRK